MSSCCCFLWSLNLVLGAVCVEFLQLFCVAVGVLLQVCIEALVHASGNTMIRQVHYCYFHYFVSANYLLALPSLSTASQPIGKSPFLAENSKEQNTAFAWHDCVFLSGLASSCCMPVCHAHTCEGPCYIFHRCSFCRAIYPIGHDQHLTSVRAQLYNAFPNS